MTAVYLIIASVCLFLGFLLGRVFGLKRANEKMLKMYYAEGIIDSKDFKLIVGSKNKL